MKGVNLMVIDAFFVLLFYCQIKMHYSKVGKVNNSKWRSIC